LGTGPATQAIQLAKRGFKVTGSDVSEAAIRGARELHLHNNANNKNMKIDFIVDDILNSKIRDKMFDYVLTGVAFMFCLLTRGQFIKEIKRILDDRGILFLKCFSIKEPRQEGPYKFSEDGIRQLFRNDFIIMSVKDTVYQGTLDPLPRSLFVVMSKE
jgi:SAM-dependent methyltransferase